MFIFYNYILFDELKNNKQFGSSKDNTFNELFLQRGERLYTSESDVYRRQILTYNKIINKFKKNNNKKRLQATQGRLISVSYTLKITEGQTQKCALHWECVYVY